MNGMDQLRIEEQLPSGVVYLELANGNLIGSFRQIKQTQKVAFGLQNYIGLLGFSQFDFEKYSLF